MVLAQFSGVGFSDGEDGIIRLTEASPYIKVHATAAMLYRLYDSRRQSSWYAITSGLDRHESRYRALSAELCVL